MGPPQGGDPAVQIVGHGQLFAGGLSVKIHHREGGSVRLRQQAVNILSIRLWTAPAGCLDAWLELLTLLEG